SLWAVRATVDALDSGCGSRRAPPAHVLPHSLATEPACLVPRSRRRRHPGGDATLPLSPSIWSPGAAADQMGRFGGHGASRVLDRRHGTQFTVPRTRQPDVTAGGALSAGSEHPRHWLSAPHPPLDWGGHPALSALGY